MTLPLCDRSTEAKVFPHHEEGERLMPCRNGLMIYYLSLLILDCTAETGELKAMESDEVAEIAAKQNVMERGRLPRLTVHPSLHMPWKQHTPKCPETSAA